MSAHFKIKNKLGLSLINRKLVDVGRVMFVIISTTYLFQQFRFLTKKRNRFYIFNITTLLTLMLV